jgi:hypothetical protein
MTSAAGYTLSMAARDVIHNAVKNALIKDGWKITDDPYTIEYGEITLSADLGAERPIAAERAGQKIVVEVKSFIGVSPIQDLKLALGQYALYLGFLEVIAPERKLYLAVSDIVYREFFEREAIQLIMRRYQVALIAVDVQKEEVVKWTN